MMDFPNNLREIRKIGKVKATDLADLLEVTFQHYYAIERGQRQLSATHLSKLSKHLNVTVDEILGEQSLHENINQEEEITKDLKRILSENNVTFEGKRLSKEDKELIGLMLSKMYMQAKDLTEKNKAENKSSQ